MSTFSGISTALSSLIAQRQALEVSGQNIANSNTVGYTRQRASISSLPAASVSSMFSTNNGPGQGTQVTGIERLGDVFIDTRVRSETAGSAYLAARASAYTSLEQGVRPWIKPWDAEHAAGRITRPLRHNGQPYSGINILMLWASAVEHGFAAPIWMTFKQAHERNHLREFK